MTSRVQPINDWSRSPRGRARDPPKLCHLGSFPRDSMIILAIGPSTAATSDSQAGITLSTFARQTFWTKLPLTPKRSTLTGPKRNWIAGRNRSRLGVDLIVPSEEVSRIPLAFSHSLR